MDEAAKSFHNLALPFGFLTCRPGVVPFYERAGWKELPGQATRMIDNDLQPETYTGPALALPVLAPVGVAIGPHGHPRWTRSLNVP